MLRLLTQRASLLARVLTPDGGGGFSESWESFAIVWASLEPQGAADAVTADRLQAKARYRVTLRRRSDIGAGQRVQLGARLFHIHGVLDAGPRAAFVTLLCEDCP